MKTVEELIEDYKNQLIEALGLGEESPMREVIDEQTYMFLTHLDELE